MKVYGFGAKSDAGWLTASGFGGPLASHRNYLEHPVSPDAR